jgi:beta-glucosidase/6-phospho-beta-glucosidase/beta-galactosidase
MPDQPNNNADSREAIFPTFFMGGFECSTFLWKDGERKDYVAKTRHDQFFERDYECAMDLGIGVVREAIRWPSVDLGGNGYDWSGVDPLIDAMNACHITPIWDLCHYGLPDRCDPFSDQCRERFVDYCRAAAEHVAARTEAPRFFTPINEITFFAAGATDLEWMYPFAKGRYDELKRALCRMSIEGAKAIREVDPAARMVHVDPLIHAVPPPDRPDLADEAWKEAYEEAYEAWDILFGRLCPEFGGSPEILDIVGVNVYHYSQAQLNADKSRKALGPRDPRRKPLSEMLEYAWERYRRPVIIGETSGYQDNRAEWLRTTMEECLKALNSGIDLHGVCLYPCVDVPDWHTGKMAQIGIYDLKDAETCERVPYQPYVDELRRWQKTLDQPEHIESDGLGHQWGRVQLAEVQRYAKEWEARTPGAERAER